VANSGIFASSSLVLQRSRQTDRTIAFSNPRMIMKTIFNSNAE